MALIKAIWPVVVGYMQPYLKKPEGIMGQFVMRFFDIANQYVQTCSLISSTVMSSVLGSEV